MLKRSLQDILSAAEAQEVVSAFDQIGQIIIVRIPDQLLPKKKLIGQTLLDQVKVAQSVFCQSSAVRGSHRTRNLEILAGRDSTMTQYKEFGCQFTVDVQNAFFSPRLSTERERIACLAADGEVLVNMFGGIGMFSIMAARRKRCTVYSIDINPAASRLCEKNIKQNKLEGTVISINGDAADILQEMGCISDRTLMLLPERSDEFLNAAAGATRDGGTIHYYMHIHAQKKADAPRLASEHYLGVTPVRSEILGSKIVRPVGPRYYQAVVDARITR